MGDGPAPQPHPALPNCAPLPVDLGCWIIRQRICDLGIRNVRVWFPAMRTWILESSCGAIGEAKENRGSRANRQQASRSRARQHRKRYGTASGPRKQKASRSGEQHARRSRDSTVPTELHAHRAAASSSRKARGARPFAAQRVVLMELARDPLPGPRGY